MTTPPTTPWIIGEPAKGRYPVLESGRLLGTIFRWHGAWYARPAATADEIRVADGRIGKDAAAHYLWRKAEAGEITPSRYAPAATEALPDGADVPLLHPRLSDTARNRAAAENARATLTRYRWTPLEGYPGADNPWAVRCALCNWEGDRFYSHLRGRNGMPPTPYRHPGCLDAAAVREQVPAYGG